MKITDIKIFSKKNLLNKSSKSFYAFECNTLTEAEQY